MPELATAAISAADNYGPPIKDENRQALARPSLPEGAVDNSQGGTLGLRHLN
jgi:hypothetical protein